MLISINTAPLLSDSRQACYRKCESAIHWAGISSLSHRAIPVLKTGSASRPLTYLGDQGRHARPVIGMGSLPDNMTVEIEAVSRLVERSLGIIRP
jgi:hypothetical protein